MVLETSSLVFYAALIVFVFLSSLTIVTVDQENQESEESASKDPVSDAKLMSNPEEDTVAETNAVDNPKESNITTDASQSIEAGELPFVYPPPPPPEASDVESRFLSAADFTTNVSASTHAENAVANSPAERRRSGFLLLAPDACK